MLDFSKVSIEPDEIIGFLKRDIQLKQVSHKILYRRIIEQAAVERGITVTPEEIQAEADKARYEMRLEKASDTVAWLTDQMIAPEDWEAGIQERLLKKK